MLRPFVHRCCCCVLLGVVAQSLKPGQTFSYMQTDATTPDNVGSRRMANNIASFCTGLESSAGE